MRNLNLDHSFFLLTGFHSSDDALRELFREAGGDEGRCGGCADESEKNEDLHGGCGCGLWI